MPRITIAAVLAFLVLLVPAASARLIDDPQLPKHEQPTHYLVQSERITDTGGSLPHKPDHRAGAPTGSLAGTTNATTAPYAQEQFYASQGDAVAAVADEQRSTAAAGSSNADVDGSPWAVVAIAVMAAALGAGAVTLTTRRSRARAA